METHPVGRVEIEAFDRIETVPTGVSVGIDKGAQVAGEGAAQVAGQKVLELVPPDARRRNLIEDQPPGL